MLLVLDIISFFAWSPNTCLTAFVSATSPSGGARAVGVDVLHVGRVPAGVAEAPPHRLGRADALLVRGGDVVGVGRVARSRRTSA